MAQHDQNVGNGSGAVVRGDVNDALAALFSLSSGATAPATTVAYQWWADTANGLLKQRNAANSGWVNHGSIASALLREANIGLSSGSLLTIDPDIASTASAATTDLASALEHNITGTTTITAFSGVSGARYRVVFSGSLTLTHHASSLILPGSSDIVTAPGDQAEIYMISSTTCRVKFFKTSGEAVNSSSLAVRLASKSASGSSVDFSGIPTSANAIVVSFSNVSLDGSGNVLVQLGDAGGFETLGYDSGSQRGGSVTVDTSTSGFILSLAGASNIAGGNMRLQRMSDTRWAEDHGARVTGLGVAVGGGVKNMSDVLTTLRVATTSGSFDGGDISVTYFVE